MDRSVFLKCLSLFFLSFFLSLSFSCSHRLSSFLHTSRAFVPFPYLAMYAFVSSVNSFVILRSFPRSLRHRITSVFAFFFLRLLLHHRFAPRTFHAFSLFISLHLSLHLCAYFTFVLLLCICVPLCISFLPSEGEACIFRSLLCSHISSAAPLNFARNYAYSKRVSTSKMQTVHSGKCISRRRRESGDQNCRKL